MGVRFEDALLERAHVLDVCGGVEVDGGVGLAAGDELARVLSDGARARALHGERVGHVDALLIRASAGVVFVVGVGHVADVEPGAIQVWVALVELPSVGHDALAVAGACAGVEPLLEVGGTLGVGAGLAVVVGGVDGAVGVADGPRGLLAGVALGPAHREVGRRGHVGFVTGLELGADGVVPRLGCVAPTSGKASEV